MNQLFICGMNISKDSTHTKFIVILSVTADSSLLSPTVGVKRISPDTAIHEQKWLRKTIRRQQYLDDHCGQ